MKNSKEQSKSTQSKAKATQNKATQNKTSDCSGSKATKGSKACK